MQYKHYSDYSEPTIMYINKIPSHWGQKKFRFLFTFGRGLGITKADLVEKGIPCINYGEIHSKYGFEVIPEKQELKCVVEDYLEQSSSSLLNFGDFVFADTSEDIEGSGNFSYLNSETPTFAGYHTVIARPTGEENSRFLAYFFDSEVYRSQIRKNVSGVKVFSVTQNILKNSYVWLPPFEEQQQITAFLDYKTQQIDQLIEKEKALIEKLEEKRIAVITQTITKGLDKNAKLKPSGVDWLGDVPVHWELSKLRYFCKKVSTGSTPSTNNDEYYENPTELWFTPSDFNDRNIKLTNSNKKLNKLAVSTSTVKQFPKDSVLLIGIGATLGKIGIAKSSFSCNQQINVIQPEESLDPYYLAYMLQSQKEVIRVISNASTLGIINQDQTKLIKICVPPINEQKLIIDHILESICSINKVQDKKYKLIERLEEYRSAIITSAVTGKIDIREVDVPKEIA